MSTSEGNHRATGPTGWTITEVPETGSTNADLMAAAAGGAPDRSVVRADHQVAGRGRLGRTWEAPPGANLLMSVLFREVPTRPHDLTRAVALAARDAAAAFGVSAVLKWPNDLLVDGRKLAGILAQSGGATASAGDGTAPDYVVVGLGLNVLWAPEGAACLADESTGRIDGPSAVMRAVLSALADHLERDAGDLHGLYASSLATLGAAVRVDMTDGAVLVGTATDVGIDGRLTVVDDDGREHRIDTGDVVHLRAR